MSQVNLTKTGIWQADSFTEYIASSFDSQVRIEPDGTLWIHIFHHNNPASNLFSSTDDFTNALYKNENLWFDFSVCNHVTQWEFLVIQANTAGAAESKVRWSQPKNPMIAAYADVPKSAITYITTSGYSTSSWGGLYHRGGNTYLCVNNGTEGNWWGATGCWTAYNGGVPAFFDTIPTTGYYDIYLRIDNLSNPKAAINKIPVITANQFYEI